ncbi:cyclin-D6-1 [Elaeis guineensis]|uniref:Cyclin-D6-1 n=1 Tax=Elaeis guineensis var. tenera TaxID=51953 RepID=A0A6I9RT12_ELAGV|nr:cyclin-D6-1 [Elaeis guineensis]
MEFVLENPLMFSDEDARHPDSISSLFAAENNFLISHRGAIILSARHDAASVAHVFSPNLGPSVIYLAINYIDRFLSSREIPLVKPCIASLLSIACLSIAAKMTINGFSLADLQGSEQPQFTTATIERMEMVVLSALGWRMRSITPFAFLDFFLHSFPLADAALRQALKDRASKTLFRIQNEGKFLEFKPSMIAASALLTAAFELFPTHFLSFRSTVLSSKFVDKETLSACCDAMLPAAMDGGSKQTVKKPGSSSDSPVTVLGRRDSDNGKTVGSSLHDRDAKKTHLA